MRAIRDGLMAAAAMCLGSPAFAAPLETGTVTNIPALATIRMVRGNAFVVVDGVTNRFRPNATFRQGSSIQTRENSEVRLSVNGISAAMAMGSMSEVALTEMSVVRSNNIRFHHTVLDMKSGLIGIEHRATNFDFLIRTPCAAISPSKASFLIRMSPAGDTETQLTCACFSGLVLVSSEDRGKPRTIKLKAGKQCGIAQGRMLVENMPESVVTSRRSLGLTLPKPLEPEPQPVAITQPFDGNGPPRQTASPRH